MNEGLVSEDGKAGWVERIFERTSTKERSTELRPIIGVIKKSIAYLSFEKLLVGGLSNNGRF